MTQQLIEGLSNRVLSTTGCKVTEQAIALIVYEYEQQRHNEPGWISAEDRLPEMEVPVLVIPADYPDHLCTAMRTDDGEFWYWAVTRSYYSNLRDGYYYEVDDDYKFTHWMPLPKPPQEQTNDG